MIPQCTRTTGGWPLRDDRRELLRDSGTGANVRNTQVGTQSINYAYCSIYINTVLQEDGPIFRQQDNVTMILLR